MWVEAGADHVHGRIEELGRDQREEAGDAGVCCQEVPPPVDDEGGVRLVVGKGELDRVASASELRSIERGLPIDRREAGSSEEHVAVAQRNVEFFREMQDHLSTRPRPAGLDEREVGGDTPAWTARSS